MPQSNEFRDVVDAAVSRRKVLFGGGLAAAAFLAPQLTGVAAAKGKTASPGRSGIAGPAEGLSADVMGFQEVGRTTADTVTVPEGYRADVLYRWADPIDGGTAPFKGMHITLDEQLRSAGQSHDGMHYFPLPTRGPNQRGLLVLNHEITETEFLFEDDSDAAWTAEKSALSMAAQGISVIEVKRTGNRWKVMPSRFARRITTTTPMELTGPAAGHALLQTSADATGTKVLGTLNNCANGFTPWGTYLTCEENFDAYFGITGPDGRSDTQRAMHAAYSLGADDYGPPLYKTEPRFDLALEPNEPNRFGWVVEIDPFDPDSTPKKRTALGRFKHENAEVVTDPEGRVIVYSGDDQAGQFIYKFVSELTMDEADAAGVSPLDSGVLHVARFDDDASGDFAGTGEWIPLTPATTGFPDHAEILIHARIAAANAGATKMDRPEWIAADPKTPGSVFCTLTNSNTGTVNDANPRPSNPNGHIIHWYEDGGDPKATRFSFEIFVLAGDPQNAAWQGDQTRVATEGIPTFTDPDGLWFDGAGYLWIQTDGTQPSGLNNQMLVADPSGSHVGGVNIKRFLVGPKGCEVTGLTQTPDGTALFVNIQHPGEGGGDDASDWPDKVGGLPRSSTIVIRREDGGPVCGPIG